MARLVVVLSLVFAAPSLLFAQNPPVSDPQALRLAAQSIAAMTGGTPISDVTLTGGVTWISGADSETGTGTLLAKGTTESRVSLTLSSNSRIDIRNGSAGQWMGGSGTSGAYAINNCWVDAVWFFPALSSLSAPQNVILKYVGQETVGGTSVFHLQSFYYAGAKRDMENAAIQSLSATDWFLDASTFLPLAMSFNLHPDDNSAANVAIWITFATYEPVNGAQLPFHISKYVQGNLVLDFTTSNAALNSGVPDSDFNLQ